MKVFVFQDLDTFDAFITDLKTNYVYIWNHSWVFIEDQNKPDVLYGYHFDNNDAYQKWRDKLEESDVLPFDVEHLFLVDKAEDLTRLLLLKEA